jgi:hypothetical protein
MIMKYWGYLVAKLAVAGLLASAILHGIQLSFPQHATRFQAHPEPFAHDLGYTTVTWLFFLFCAGLLYLIALDQRYRCRTCLRRLRMPMRAGSWPNMLLFGHPRTEYICLYGHGTLRVSEVQITGSTSPDWQPHDEDIWKELETIEAAKR